MLQTFFIIFIVNGGPFMMREMAKFFEDPENEVPGVAHTPPIVKEVLCALRHVGVA